MPEKKSKRIERPATTEDRKRHAEIRQKIMQEFSPTQDTAREPSPPGLPTQIRQAREARGLTWYALAKLAGIPNPNTVRDIESGREIGRRAPHRRERPGLGSCRLGLQTGCPNGPHLAGQAVRNDGGCGLE